MPYSHFTSKIRSAALSASLTLFILASWRRTEFPSGAYSETIPHGQQHSAGVVDVLMSDFRKQSKTGFTKLFRMDLNSPQS
jgi:hypothetical protein